jgi:phosphoglycerate kinase
MRRAKALVFRHAIHTVIAQIEPSRRKLGLSAGSAQYLRSVRNCFAEEQCFRQLFRMHWSASFIYGDFSFDGMRTCQDVPAGSTVFVRTGMDVPLSANGAITDASRIEESRATIDVLRANGCKLVIATHLGRPKGHEAALSAKPVAEYLGQFYPTRFVPDVTGSAVDDAKQALVAGELLVIENLRFDPREEANDDAFAQELLVGVDCVVQDSYANAHRSHASMIAVLQHRPGYAGLLLQKELSMVAKLASPEHPFVAIIGGAKADKLTTIKGLLGTVDVVLVGGVLANTFLKAASFPVGDSKVDDSGLALARELYESGKILVPVDAVVAAEFSQDSAHETQPIGSVARGHILDIGPVTRERYVQEIASARSIVWGGPIGVFEWEQYSEGTKAVAAAVSQATKRGAFTLAAGGDSGAALVSLGYKDQVSHVSTGGGVTLELLEGKTLPAVAALEANEKQFP